MPEHIANREGAVRSLCNFIDASYTAYHAAENISAALSARGARELSERDAWNLEPGVAYFVRRGGSAVIAFRTGMLPPGGSGFVLSGGHTDSPGLKVRIEKALIARNLARTPVEVYGGAILSGWLDRPLSLAGRLAVRTGEGIREVLYASQEPVGVIPNLAIHLNREINKGIEYNPHQHLPVLVDTIDARDGKSAREWPWALSRAASELGISPDAVLGADLFFVEAQPCREFGNLVNGPRLDDLAGCHSVLEAFLQSPPTPHGQIACFMDAEEVGSMTAQGADSSFMRDVIARILLAAGAPAQDFYRALARSLFVSVDASQAWHPAYAEKFDEFYAPLLNGGPALKAGANWKYATDAGAEAMFREACARAGVAPQKYMSRPDILPGSTIGPMTSSHLGVRTVDVGHPLLGMHAIRETIGASDHPRMIAALTASYAQPPEAPGPAAAGTP